MNKYLLAVVLGLSLLLSACGADEKHINGVTYDTYGIFNEGETKNDDIHYEISGWSIFWSILFSETIIVPIYFIGFDLYEPVIQKGPDWVKGQTK